jgi:predicted peroxiredoxin
MRMRALKWFAGLLVLGVVAVPVLAGGHGEAKAPRLLTILTSDENDTQGMALILTTHYVRGGGEARILLCDDAADLAVKGSDEGSTVLQPANASPRQMLQGLLQAGVTVEVCAIHLPNRPWSQADLVDGVGVAAPPAIAALMANPEWRLFTF